MSPDQWQRWRTRRFQPLDSNGRPTAGIPVRRSVPNADLLRIWRRQNELPRWRGPVCHDALECPQRRLPSEARLRPVEAGPAVLHPQAQRSVLSGSAIVSRQRGVETGGRPAPGLHVHIARQPGNVEGVLAVEARCSNSATVKLASEFDGSASR